MIEWIQWPSGVVHHRDLWFADRLERPVRRFCRAFAVRRFLRNVRARVWRADLYPFDEIVDHRLGQWIIWRHAVFVGSADGLDDQALVGFSCDQRRTRFAAAQQARAAIEQQFAAELLRVGRVTFVAVRDQHRADLVFEKRPSVCGKWVSCASGAG